jgi:hypothetical protein
MLESAFYGVNAQGENPRELEMRQIVRLMSMIAEAYYANGKYDFTRSMEKIENRLRKGEKIPDDHLRAYRIGREEVLSSWLPFVGKVIEHYFINIGKIVHKERLFQYKFPEQLWVNISNFLDNLGRVPVWVDYQLSLTAFGGKAPAGFWKHIFETGNDPKGAPIIHSGGLNLLEMIKAG